MLPCFNWMIELLRRCKSVRNRPPGGGPVPASIARAFVQEALNDRKRGSSCRQLVIRADKWHEKPVLSPACSFCWVTLPFPAHFENLCAGTPTAPCPLRRAENRLRGTFISISARRPGRPRKRKGAFHLEAGRDADLSAKLICFRSGRRPSRRANQIVKAAVFNWRITLSHNVTHIGACLSVARIRQRDRSNRFESEGPAVHDVVVVVKRIPSVSAVTLHGFFPGQPVVKAANQVNPSRGISPELIHACANKECRDGPQDPSGRVYLRRRITSAPCRQF